MSERKVIDWEEAMAGVGGDEDFLSEVLQDLLNESDSAENEIREGIRAQDYQVVMKAAHRIKGSASYLYCEELKHYSLQLQDAGNAAINTPPSQSDLQNMNALFENYRQSLIKLKQEIKTRGKK